MGKDYEVSYRVTFRFDDWDDEDIRNKDLVAATLSDTLYEWLHHGGHPNPDTIEVELAE